LSQGSRLAIATALVALTALPVVFVDLYVLFIVCDFIPVPASWGHDAGDPIRLAMVGMTFGPIVWGLHPLALSVWTWIFTRACEAAGTPGAWRARSAALAWWVPGFNLVGPWLHLQALARGLADKAAHGLVLGWWALAVVASLAKYGVFAAMAATSGPMPAVTTVFMVMALAEIASFGACVTLLIVLQVAWQRHAPAAA
jgi:hypothetical protein